MADTPTLNDLALDLERRGKPIEAALVDLVGALEEKLERLEMEVVEVRAASMRYRGTWSGGSGTYTRGDCVTRDGSLWSCVRDGTQDTPGRGSGWQLMTKSHDRKEAGR